MLKRKVEWVRDVKDVVLGLRVEGIRVNGGEMMKRLNMRGEVVDVVEDLVGVVGDWM